MRRRLVRLAVAVGALSLVASCGAGAGDRVGQDRVYGPQPRESVPAWPRISAVEVGAQQAPWWPVASARDLRPTGIDVVASSGIGRMEVDGAGIVWVDLPWGLVRLDPVTWSATAWDAGDDVAFASKWFVRASSGSGVWLFGRDRARLFDGVRVVRDIQVPSAYLGVDGAGILDLIEVGTELWIAGTAGVARCDGHAWSMVGEDQPADVDSLQLTPWGEVWAGAGTSGPLSRWSRYDGTKWRPTELGHFSAVDAFGWDPTGGLVATSGATVMHYDGAGWQVLLRPGREEDDGPAGVRAVAASGDGTVWAVTGEALLRSSDRREWHALNPPVGARLTGLVVAGDEVLVAADTGVYRVAGDDLEPVWSPGTAAVSDEIVDVVAASGEDAWVVAADWSGESAGYRLHELQIGRGDPVLTRSLAAWAEQAEWGWPRSGLGSAAAVASDGAVWYATDEAVVRLADGTESVVATRSGERLLRELAVNVNVVAMDSGGPGRDDPRPREIGPDAFAELTVPGKVIEQTLYGDGDISCPKHWAHDLSLPVGQVRYTPTPKGMEITVSLTGAWPDTEYYVEVNTDQFCQTLWSAEPTAENQFEGLVTDQDGAGSLTLTYPWPPTSVSGQSGVRLLAGDDGAVWVLSMESGWIEPADRVPGETPGPEGLRLLAPDGGVTQVDLPAPARDTMVLAAGAGDHLWATVCEGGTEPDGWGLPTCPGGWQLMHREGDGWMPVAFPAADVWGLGASRDGGFWAILADSPGGFEHGVLAHYRQGRWTTVPEPAGVSPYDDSTVTPAGSVCRIEVTGPTLVCVDTSLRLSRTPVAMTGDVTVAADGTVWVSDYSAVARLPITVPD